MSKQRLVASRAVSRALVTCAALCLLAAPSTIRAQEILAELRIETGLMTFFATPDRSAVITVTERGGRDVTSSVRFAAFGPDEQVVARRIDTLAVGHPATFNLQLDDRMPRQLRFTVSIVGTSGRNTQPIVILEDVDGASFTIGERFSCAPPANREGPVTPWCPEVIIRNLTIGG